MASKRREDIKFIYTQDDETEKITPQQIYYDTISGNTLTPTTSLFLARQVASTTKVENPKEIDHRHVMAYIDNPNVSTGVSNMKQYIPYAPGDISHTAQLREILALPRVICVDYYGEVRRSF